MPDIGGIPYVESSDLVSAWPTVSQSVAQEVSDQLASKLPYSYGTATPSTTDSGFLWYDSNSTPAAPKFWDGAAFQEFGGGKLLQVVYGSTTTSTATTSTSFVDSTLSASITPSKTTSKVLILVSQSCYANRAGAAAQGKLQIVRSSTAVFTGQNEQFGIYEGGSTDIGLRGVVSMNYLDSPSTTSATTYKTQQAANSGHQFTTQVQSNPSTIILLEIAA